MENFVNNVLLLVSIRQQISIEISKGINMDIDEVNRLKIIEKQILE